MAFESRGIVTFTVEASPRAFHYVITAADEKLRIWIEDTVTKQQWQTNSLAMSDFVTIKNAIPQFKTNHYAERVVECLNPTAETEDPARSYELTSPAADGTRIFAVAFSLQFMTMTTVLQYRFELAQVDLDRVELLTARMGDVEATLSSVDAVCKDVRDEMRLQFATLLGLLQHRQFSTESETLHCPIGLELMKDPVITPSGVTYDRSFIEAHLKSGKGVDPSTNAPLTLKQLVPNRALKDIIDRVRAHETM